MFILEMYSDMVFSRPVTWQPYSFEVECLSNLQENFDEGTLKRKALATNSNGRYGVMIGLNKKDKI